MGSADHVAETKSVVSEDTSRGSTPSNRPTTLSYNEAHQPSDPTHRSVVSAARLSTTPISSFLPPASLVEEDVSTHDSSAYEGTVLRRKQTALWYAMVATDSTISQHTDLSGEHNVHTTTDVRSLIRALRPPGVMRTSKPRKFVVRRINRKSSRFQKSPTAEPVVAPNHEPRSQLIATYVRVLVSAAVFMALVGSAVAGWYGRGLWNAAVSARTVHTEAAVIAPVVAPSVVAPSVVAPSVVAPSVVAPSVVAPQRLNAEPVPMPETTPVRGIARETHRRREEGSRTHIRVHRTHSRQH
jgi:hypothetical protein